MEFSFFIMVALAVSGCALPAIIIEGENGIIVNDDRSVTQVGDDAGITKNADGSTQIGGEDGITVNSEGQTTNVGGSSGITVTPSTNSGNKTTGEEGNSTAAASKPKGTGSDLDGLAALISAIGGASSESKNGTETGKASVDAPAAAALAERF